MDDFINKSPALNQMSFSPNMPSISTGDPLIDQVISMLLMGSNLAPRPHGGQSQFEAFQQRQRSFGFLETMRTSFGNQNAFQKLGGMDPKTAQLLAMFAGRPDGPMDSGIMRAINGGNPVAAAMGLHAGMTGMTSTMGFGQAGNVTPKEVSRMMESLYNTMFETRKYAKADVQDATARINSETQQRVMGSKQSKTALSDFIKKGADGKEFFDNTEFDKVRKETADFTKNLKKGITEEALKEYKKVMAIRDPIAGLDAKIGTIVTGKMKFEETRGWQQQDFTKSYMMAMDMGMYQADKYQKGGDKGLGHWMKNSAGLLRATADITGAETGEEAQRQMGDLFGGTTVQGNSIGETWTRGNSSIDIGSNADTGNATKLLRDFKGASNAAGVGMDAVMEINRTVKAMASKYSTTQGMGGMGSMHETIAVIQQTQAMSAAMGQDWVRKQGGTAALSKEIASNRSENENEEVSKNSYAMLYAIDNDNSMTAEQKEKGKAIIVDAKNHPEKFSGPSGVMDLADDVGAAVGRTGFQMNSISQDASMRTAGFKAVTEGKISQGGKVISGDLGDDIAVGQTATQMDNNDSFNIQAALDNGVPITGKDGKRLTTVDEVLEERRNRFANIRESHEDPSKIMASLGLTGKQYEDWDQSTADGRRSVMNYTKWQQQTRNPHYRKNLELQQTLTKQYSKQSEEYSKRFAKFQAKPLDVLMQSFINGQWKTGAQGLLDEISTPELHKRAESMMNATNSMNELGTTDSMVNAFNEANGGATGLSEDQVRKNLATEGRSQSEINQAVFKRGVFGADGAVDNITDVSKQLTMNQILASSDNYANSAAKEKGISEEAVNRAAKTLRGSGLTTDDYVKAYGNTKLDKKQLSRLLTHNDVKAFGSMFEKDSMQQLDTQAGAAIRASLHDESDDEGKAQSSELRRAFRVAGLGEYQDADFKDNKQVDAVADKLKERSIDADTWSEMNQQFGDDTGDINYDAMRKGANNLSQKAKDALKAKGMITTDKDGKVTGFDSDKIRQGRIQDIAKEKITEENSPIGNALKSRQDLVDEVKKQKEALTGGNADGAMSDTLKQLTSILTTSSTGITDALAQLTSALNNVSQ